MVLLKATGFNFGFTTQAVNVKVGDNPFELGRKLVYPTTSLEKFKNIVKTSSAVTGWSYNDGKMYYYDENGNKKTSWFKDGDKQYYFDTDGVMQTGWLQFGQEGYYFYHSGNMACSTTIYGSMIGPDGTWIH